MSTAMLIAVIVIVIAVAVAAWFFIQREKSRKLRGKFGPEYDRTVQERGDVRKAEAELENRQKRVSKLNIRPLNREERDGFAADWRRVQERFVDDPRGAVRDADALINQALKARGYPVGEFEQNAADISVEHPRVVEDYRTAHDIAVRDSRGQASTEDLRKAMQHYRSLFEHVLETRVTQYEEVRR